MSKHPIGIFDSGVGGICVLKEIKKLLPCESINYFADSRNCPYGSKAKEKALFLARKNIEFLLEQNCKMIVIACNTVTAVAIDRFRSDYNIPFIGMEPALKPAVLRTKTRKIGILATENTFNGRLFKQTFERYANGMEVFVQPGYGLVELVEKGAQNSGKARCLLEEYLLPMLAKGVDTIVLGCTHYPFLKDMIKRVTKNSVTIIDPADAVAVQAKRILVEFNLISNNSADPEFHFYTTGEKTIAEKFFCHIMSEPYGLEQVKI
ncbi:MAG: glutamate racemase [Deltaproteobacteria bacterium]|nr:glutamate racemase [Deltaproteobacteria bacterium]